jgi:hypothetical protein
MPTPRVPEGQTTLTTISSTGDTVLSAMSKEKLFEQYKDVFSAERGCFEGSGSSSESSEVTSTQNTSSCEREV